MWTKTLRKNTNLSPQLVARALKNLAQRSLVKSVKSIQSATKKLYMLAELEPATEITGGAWHARSPYPTPSHLKLHMLHELKLAAEITGGAWRACLPACLC